MKLAIRSKDIRVATLEGVKDGSVGGGGMDLSFTWGTSKATPKDSGEGSGVSVTTTTEVSVEGVNAVFKLDISNALRGGED
ncbi:hypothetical protein WN55_07561 [Dufourea novaeangliae]|uniref:Uncharacterized protein n=1 Tax=Dufourea novaeangliae TaxID=178035 RepID=A0A154PSL1_DUFNO|nr:hypothetical protein WN55_07561 [Dufourea novaeangliae]